MEYGEIIQKQLKISFLLSMIFVICLSGLKLGRVFGTKLERYAGLIGGPILIIIGLEIFIKSFI